MRFGVGVVQPKEVLGRWLRGQGNSEQLSERALTLGELVGDVSPTCGGLLGRP